MQERPQDQLTEEDMPEMGALHEEYNQATTNDEAIDARLIVLEAIRYARWPGQTPDCVQHEEAYAAVGREVLWPGAADARILLTDDTINALVDLFVTAFNGAQMKTSPITVKPLSAAQSGELFVVLNWLKTGPLAEDLVDNVEISAQFTNMIGWCVLHPRWERRKVVSQRKITMDMVRAIATKAAQAQPDNSPSPRPSPAGRGSMLAALPEMIADPETEEACAELFQTFFPDTTKADARKHVRELRTQGETEFEEVRETNVGPKIDVLCPWYHFILPIEATSRPRDARVRFVRMLIPKWRIDELAFAQDWDDADFIEALKNTTGTAQEPPSTRENDRDWNRNLCEVVWAYRTVVKKNGAVTMRCTVMSPQVKPQTGGHRGKGEFGKDWALNTINDDVFVYCRREATDFCITDTRGVPDTTATEQNEMKNFRDATYNYTQLSVTPPIQRMGTAASKEDPAFGPFAIIDNPSSNKPYVPLDLVSGANIEVPFKLQEMLRKEVEDRHGLDRADTVPSRTMRKQQRMVGRFLAAWGRAFMMSAILAYQNAREELAELLGHEPLLDADTLVKHMISMGYDVRTGNSEFLDRLEKTFTAILSAGLGNDLNLGAIVSYWLSLIDPNAAKEFVPQDQAPQRQAAKDARDELNNVMMGNSPMLVEKDPAAQAKINTVKQLVTKNPRYQAKLNPKHNEFDEGIAQNFQTMMDNWQHSVQETVLSKAQGRLGVKNVSQ